MRIASPPFTNRFSPCLIKIANLNFRTQTNLITGILRLRIHCPPPSPRPPPRNPRLPASLARRVLLPRRRRLPPYIRPPGRHVRRVPHLRRWHGLVDHLVARLRILHWRDDVECLSSHGRTWAERVSAGECDAYGEYLSAWAEEKFGV